MAATLWKHFIYLHSEYL